MFTVQDKRRRRKVFDLWVKVTSMDWADKKKKEEKAYDDRTGQDRGSLVDTRALLRFTFLFLVDLLH